MTLETVEPRAEWASELAAAPMSERASMLRALSQLKSVRQLTGLSGAKVFLCSEDGRHFFVRKLAEGSNQVKRLRIQIQKQEWFDKNVSAVSTPKVLACYGDDNAFWYDMEYVQGLDAVSYLHQVGYGEVKQFGECLRSYLKEASLVPPALNTAPPTLFQQLYAKLCSIQSQTRVISPEVLGRLFLALERLLPLEGLAPTLCHGDLTLENMIVTPEGRIVVLDMIPAPFEHFWHDVAKLHQDLAGGWYLRHHRPIAQSVLDFLSRGLLASAIEINPVYEHVHNLLTAIVFARILPYADSDETQHFVLARLDHFSRLAQS